MRERDAHTILVLDDEQYQVDILKEMLEGCGYSVHVSMSADQALNAMQQSLYDAVLFDYLMPKKNGFLFMQEARRVQPQAKFIMVTGCVTHELVDSAFKEGACAYIAKPFSQEGILCALDAHISDSV